MRFRGFDELRKVLKSRLKSQNFLVDWTQKRIYEMDRKTCKLLCELKIFHSKMQPGYTFKERKLIKSDRTRKQLNIDFYLPNNECNNHCNIQTIWLDQKNKI